MNLEPSIVPGMNIPMIIASNELNVTPLLTVLREHREYIIKQLNQQGALLFRGFACQDQEHFSKAIEICNLGTRCDTRDYSLARTVFDNEIYTSSDLPGHIPLPLHHEKPRSENPPNHLYFCCVIPAEDGGGTIFANAEAIWLAMPKTIQDKIRQQGVSYKRFFHSKSLKSSLLKKIFGDKSALNWQDNFACNDKRSLEEKLEQAQTSWEWAKNGKDLILTSRLAGALEHPFNQRTCWFNSAEYLNFYSNFTYGELKDLRSYKALAARYLVANDQLPLICHYGNGDPFSVEEIAKIKEVIQQHVCVFSWEMGDFMIVDNYTFMHGKQPHQGQRLLYSCMTIMPQ